MGRIEKSIEIRAPPEKVWEMLALDRLPEWNEEYGNVKYTSELRNPEDKYKVGASSHTNLKGAGAIDFEITESLKNEKMTFR
ncbi:MAG: SRPBCC family protein, partial [Candidatus Bathyarchaeia archaeon]